MGGIVGVIAGAFISETIGPIIGGAVGSAIFGRVAGSVIGGLAGGFIGSIFGGGRQEPQAPTFTQELRDNLITIRQPITHWQYIYGRARVGGALTFAHESADDNFHLIITFAGHVCQEIEQVQLNDEVVPLDGSGNATGKYAGYVRIIKSLGDEAGQPFPALVAESGGKWTDAHRQSGRAKIYVRLTPNADLFPTGVPNITAVIKGRRIYDPRSGLTVWSDSASLCDVDYLRDLPAGLGAVYASEIDNAQLIAAADIDDEAVALAAATPTATFTADAATDALTLAAGAKVAALGGGVRVASSGALPAGLAAATTYYVAIAGGGAIKLATTLANARAGTAIDITSAGSGTHTLTYFDEPRYTLNGSFSVNQAPREILGRMLSANAGKARYVGGVWRLHPAAYVAPTITLSEDDCRAVPNITPRLSGDELSNAVKGVFVSEANLWQPSDFPPVTNATYLAEDNTERSWRELDLAYTKSSATAQRIAKIELERMRQQISVEWHGKFNCYRLQPGDTVKITFALLGWSEKIFEVTQAGLAFEEDSDGGVRIGCDLMLRETASAVFDWDSGEETVVDAAPDTNLPDPFTVGVPGTPSVAETLYETTGSAGVKARATVTWAAAADQNVAQGGYYELEYKLAADSGYTRISPISAATQALDDLAPATYNFRVRAVNSIGVHSAYSGVSTKELLGLIADPADVTGFAVQVISGQALAMLDQSPDLDVRIGGRLFLRWSPLSAGAIWNDGMLLSPDGWPGDSVSVFAPLMGGTYLAKFRDSSGNWSANAASFVLTEAHLTGFTTLATVTEHPGFSGVKVNTAAVDGGVQLVGATLWDDLGLIDSEGMIDSAGGIVTAGSYTFANRVDLGSVLTVRLFPNLKSLAFDTADLWDSRTNPIDDWGFVDGSVIEDAEVALEVRITNDDPAGAPTWGPWHALPGQADYSARAFEFRVQFTSANVTHNRKVTELSVAAKQPT
jgi:hypothetical protein